MEKASRLASVTGDPDPSGSSEQRLLLRAATSRAKCASGLCDGCKGLRLVIREDQGRPRLHTEPCPKAQEALRREHSARSGVATPGGPLPTQSIDAQGLTIWVGPEPVSGALQALVQAWVDAGYQGLYVHMPKAFAVRQDWNAVSHSLAQADLLVLDRWDKFRPPPTRKWQVDSLCNILTQRSRARVPSVVKMTAPLRVVCSPAERDLFERWTIG